ncbi:MAG TPA: MFS transporter [Mycobacteriales bacterium]|nr:MFS transporter [Mycobacteriales bacterium]
MDTRYEGRATRRDWLGLAVLVLPCFLVSMDGEVLNLAVPKIVADLHPGNAQLLWIVDGYVFVVAGALLAMGALGDRIGRRRLLLVGATLFGAASLAAAFASTPALLIAARVLMGLAGASLMPSTLALIRGLFVDRRQRTAALGVWTAGFSLGGLLAPVLGGVLLDRFWWGSVFLVAVPVTLLLLVVGPAVLPEFRDPDATGFDLPGAALSLLAVLTLVYGIKRAAAGGGLPAAGVAALLGVVLGAAFGRRQRRAARPMIDPALLRTGAVRVALLANALTFFALYGTQVAVAQYLQWVLGLSPLRAGLWSIPSVLAYLAGTAIGPAAVSRFPPTRVIGTGLVVSAAGCGLLTQVSGGLGVIVAGTVVFGVGLAPVYTLCTDLIVTRTRPEQAAVAGAVAETGAELGGALGIALLGSLGVAVYRAATGGATAGLPPDAAADARRTLGDAAAVAGTLPGVRGEELLQQTRSAFEQAFAAIAGAACLAILAAAIAVALAGLRRARSEAAARRPAEAGVRRRSRR